MSRPAKTSASGGTAASAAGCTVTMCHGCCCGQAEKNPRTDHAAQLARLREALPLGARLRQSDCLDVCERSNVVVIGLIDIVTALDARGVGVKSLTNGIIDTTTAHGKLVFGMFALMAEYEAALIRERTQAGLQAARDRGRKGGRKPKMTPELIGKAQRMYDSRQFTMAEIASSRAVTPMTVYRNIHTGQQPAQA